MSELLAPGLELMSVGMGIVFIFLAMLIIIVNIMSGIVSRFTKEPMPEMKKTTGDEIDANVLAAISAAVHRHRARHIKTW